VLKRNESIGRAVMSGEVTRPGFICGLNSMNQNLFLGSQAYAELSGDLEHLGLCYGTSQKPYRNVFPDESSLRVYSEPERTLELLRGHNARDAEGWVNCTRSTRASARRSCPFWVHRCLLQRPPGSSPRLSAAPAPASW
jgi:phytoene dehydrogenase-like protein